MQTEIKWSLIFAAVSLLWTLLLQVLGVHDKHIAWHPYISLMFFIPAVGMYVMALREKRNVLGGRISYKSACISGIVMAVVITVLSPLVQWIIHRVIAPGYFRSVIDYSVKSGYMTLEQAQANFNLRSYLVQATVGALIAGLLTTLVVAAFVRTKAA